MWLTKKINHLWWLSKWRNYEIPFHKHAVSPELIDYFHTLKLKPGAHVLVPLCGKSKDLHWLATQNLKVTGVELSPIACKEFFKELNVKPKMTQFKNFVSYEYNNLTLLCGNIFKLNSKLLLDVDAVFDHRALIALPFDVRKQYIEHLISILGHKIKILLINFSSHSKIKGPPYSIFNEEINALFSSHFNLEILNNELKKPPEHLIKRGFDQINVSIYLITPIYKQEFVCLSAGLSH